MTDPRVPPGATGLTREGLRGLARRFGVGMLLARHQADNGGVRVEP